MTGDVFRGNLDQSRLTTVHLWCYVFRVSGDIQS